MTTLIFDTETTGLAKEKRSPVDPSQPMPMQLGMKLDADNRREVAAMNFLIQPMGWSIEPKASEITGITDQMATAYGTHLVTAVDLFLDMIKAADTVVAHNIAFDRIVMQRACFVYSEMMGTPYSDPFEGKKMVCTMMASLNIVQALPKRRGEWKWPKLTEAVKYFFNEELIGAHDALVDVRGCARVYYELIDIGAFSGNYRYAE